VAVHPEQPEGVGGVPVILVAVEDDRGVVGDAAAGHQPRELLLGDKIAPHLILLVGVPVDRDGAGDVPQFVEQHVFVRFHDAYGRVVQALGQPLSRYQRLGVRITLNHYSVPFMIKPSDSSLDRGVSKTALYRASSTPALSGHPAHEALHHAAQARAYAAQAGAYAAGHHGAAHAGQPRVFAGIPYYRTTSVPCMPCWAWPGTGQI